MSACQLVFPHWVRNDADIQACLEEFAIRVMRAFTECVCVSPWHTTHLVHVRRGMLKSAFLAEGNPGLTLGMHLDARVRPYAMNLATRYQEYLLRAYSKSEKYISHVIFTLAFDEYTLRSMTLEKIVCMSREEVVQGLMEFVKTMGEYGNDYTLMTDREMSAWQEAHPYLSPLPFYATQLAFSAIGCKPIRANHGVRAKIMAIPDMGGRRPFRVMSKGDLVLRVHNGVAYAILYPTRARAKVARDPASANLDALTEAALVAAPFPETPATPPKSMKTRGYAPSSRAEPPCTPPQQPRRPAGPPPAPLRHGSYARRGSNWVLYPDE